MGMSCLAMDGRERAAMQSCDLGEMRAYRERLRRYTAEDLEDIYFHIHILDYPVRYRLLMMEMEARHLRPPGDLAAPARAVDLSAWLGSFPLLARHRLLKAVLLSIALTGATAAVTLAMLAPIWLFAMPLRFLGLQTAIVYFACAPVPPILGAALGGRMGGRGVYGVWVVLGVALALVLFSATGAPAAIVRPILQPQGAGGYAFGGF